MFDPTAIYLRCESQRHGGGEVNAWTATAMWTSHNTNTIVLCRYSSKSFWRLRGKDELLYKHGGWMYLPIWNVLTDIWDSISNDCRSWQSECRRIPMQARFQIQWITWKLVVIYWLKRGVLSLSCFVCCSMWLRSSETRSCSDFFFIWYLMKF